MSQIMRPNKISRGYLETPSWNFILRGLDQSEKKKVLQVHDCLQLIDQNETPTVLNSIQKSFRVHNWRSKKNINIRMEESYINALKTVHIMKDLRLTQIKHLKLSLEPDKQSNSNLDYFSTYFIGFPKSLQSLYFELGSPILTDRSLKHFGSVIGRNLSNLTKLEIYISGSENVADNGLQSLCSQICRYLPKLKFFTIGFSKCVNITNAGLERLGSFLAYYLTDLQSLKIYFGNIQKISDDGLKPLLLNLRNNLKNLKNFGLIFWGCQITDNGMKALVDYIEHDLSGLQRISFHFSDCKQITDAGFQTIQNTLATFLPNLTHLDLDFSNCQITDQSLDKFRLKQFQSLRQLSIRLAGHNHITEEGFTWLIMKELSHLQNIEHLELSFSRNNNITDKEIETLFFQLDHLFKKLTSLSLWFMSCYGITDESLDLIIEKVKSNMTNLKQFHLLLYGSGVSRDKKEEAKKTLSYIPKLWIS